MEERVKKIHSEILKSLRDYRRRKPDLRFITRKSDINKRLSNGYWFHGNDEYIAMSFWTGMDWVRKVPNISIIIDIETGNISLELSSKDSQEKRDLLFDTFKDSFELQVKEDYLFTKSLHYNHYNNRNWIIHFIEYERIIIDDILNNNRRSFLTKQNSKNRIGHIEEIEFRKSLQRIKKYEQRKSFEDLPFCINSIDVTNFGLIENVSLNNLPTNSQWIFITGENSSGKTSFLKALSIAICNGGIPDGPKNRLPKDFSIKLILNKTGKPSRPYLIGRNRNTDNFELLSKGFVAYGPTRINIRDGLFNNHPNRGFRSILNRPYNSLFNTSSSLIDIGYLYAQSDKFPDEVKIIESKYSYITEMITQLCESIVDIHFGKRLEFFLAEEYRRNTDRRGLIFEDLSSGFRNIIAMVSDMLIHLYYQQSEVTDPSELVGIVIIDEIDLHFHPRLQRDFIGKLGELFPRVQFIVSTHSPIPLLGAPEGSVFLNIKWVKDEGVKLTRLKKLEKEIANLLPNSIYTSDIFGLDEIDSIQNDKEEDIHIENYYSEIEENEELNKRLKQFEESSVKFPSKLFK